MIEDLRFDCSIVRLLGRVNGALSSLVLRLAGDVGDLLSIEIVLSILWPCILNRLLKLLLLLLADGRLVLIIDVLLRRQLVLTALAGDVLSEQLVLLNQVGDFAVGVQVCLLGRSMDGAPPAAD